MNKMIIVTIATVATIILVGCNNVENSKDLDKAWNYHGMNCYTKVIEIEGHKYIIMTGMNFGGIIHANSCGCVKK